MQTHDDQVKLRCSTILLHGFNEQPDAETNKKAQELGFDRDLEKLLQNELKNQNNDAALLKSIIKIIKEKRGLK